MFKNAPLKKREIEWICLVMIPRFPAVLSGQSVFITEIQAVSFEISWFPSAGIFYLPFVRTVHFDLAQLVLGFLTNHHHPRINQLQNQIPLSCTDASVKKDPLLMIILLDINVNYIYQQLC